MTTLSDATIRAHQQQRDDEAALKDHRAVCDRLLREYIETGAAHGPESFFTLTAEFLWHAEQRQFYALLNSYNYLYGEVPQWVGDLLTPQEDGTP